MSTRITSSEKPHPCAGLARATVGEASGAADRKERARWETEREGEGRRGRGREREHKEGAHAHHGRGNGERKTSSVQQLWKLVQPGRNTILRVEALPSGGTAARSIRQREKEREREADKDDDR